MENIPTARQFLDKKFYKGVAFWDGDGSGMWSKTDEVMESMIEFAKLHVKATHEHYQKQTDDIILSAYPESNIK